MYKLPKRVTGLGTDFKVSLEAFKELCYSLHGLGLISVYEIEGYRYPNNYYSARVADQEGQFYIYINCFVSEIAFGIISNESEIYFEKPELANALFSLDFPGTVVSPEVLKSAVFPEALTNLNDSEIRAINNWLPDTIGKILFSSYFD